MENIKSKKQYETDLLEVRDLIKGAICDQCTSNLRSIAKNEDHKKPSTLHKAASSDKPQKRAKANSAITIPGGGNTVKMMMTLFGFVSLLCIAGYTLAPSTGSTSLLAQAPTMASATNNLQGLRNLAGETYNCDVDECIDLKNDYDTLDLPIDLNNNFEIEKLIT